MGIRIGLGPHCSEITHGQSHSLCFPSFLVSVCFVRECAHVCSHEHGHMCVLMLMHMCMWYVCMDRPEVDVGNLPQLLSNKPRACGQGRFSQPTCFPCLYFSGAIGA